MRNYIGIFTVGAMLLAVGCAKDDTVGTKVLGGKTIIGAGISETRTSLGELENGLRKVYWSNGDAIAVNGVASAALADVEEKSTMAEFAFDGVLNLPYKAVYPASAYTDANTITLAPVQAKSDNSFGENAEPMAAYADAEGDLQFRHLCAVVKVSLTADADADEIAYVEFRGNNSEQVSGAFAIDYENAALTAASIADADKTVRVKVERALTTDGAADVFAVVPAGRYENGFTVKVVDVYGHYMEKSTAKPQTLVAGQILSMPAFAFVPTGTILGVEIGSAAELAAFAKAYNAREYYDAAPLFVTLTDDIIFDEQTNAEFESIGTPDEGDGVSNYFNGSFNGNGKTVKMYASNKPLFAYCGSDGIIYDLTIDASCSFTVDAASPQYVAAFVGYHKGMLRNCISNAPITFGEASRDDSMAVGGLAGRSIEGVVEECSMTGNITVPKAFVSNNDINIGGIVGYNTNASGVIRKSSFGGAISWSGEFPPIEIGSSGVSKGWRACIGGIAGRIAGRVEGCSTSESASLATLGNATYTTALGGIVGVVNAGAVVDNCENKAQLNTKMQRSNDDGTNDASRYEYLGGIAGISDGTVSNCINSSNLVESRSACKSTSVGGVVGYSRAVVSGCRNSAEVAARTSGVTPYGARYLCIGGVVGNVSDAAAVSDLANTGDVKVSRLENNAGVTLAMGGCVGQSYAALGTKFSNSGNLTFEANNTNHKWSALGGIVGYASASVADSENSGSVTMKPSVKYKNAFVGGVVGQLSSTADVVITNVENSGKIRLDPTKAGLGHTNVALGGVLGLAENTPLTISASSNTGDVVRTSEGTKVNGAGSFAGGIAGCVRNAKAVIENCDNTSAVNEGNFSNSFTDTGAPFGGGIVGFIAGSSADNGVAIRNCRNLISDTAELYAKRGYIGGIAGFARYAIIEGCRNYVSARNNSETTNIAGYTGGIAGAAVSTVVRDCINKADLHSTNEYSYVGGIVSQLTAGSKVESSKSFGALTANAKTLAQFGGIASQSETGTAISDCGFGGTLNGVAITDVSEVCGDTNATLTDNYIWDGVE